MSSSYVKLVLASLGLAGLLVLSGCAVGAGPDGDEGTSTSALESQDEQVMRDSEESSGSSNKLRPDLPRERPQLNLIPVDQMAGSPPSPWKGQGGPPR